MKAYISIIDPVHEKQESAKLEDCDKAAACKLFGYNNDDVSWSTTATYQNQFPGMEKVSVHTGIIRDTSKIITIIEIK